LAGEKSGLKIKMSHSLKIKMTKKVGNCENLSFLGRATSKAIVPTVKKIAVYAVFRKHYFPGNYDKSAKKARRQLFSFGLFCVLEPKYRLVGNGNSDGRGQITWKERLVLSGWRLPLHAFWRPSWTDFHPKQT
jgi:hypothetical protein